MNEIKQLFRSGFFHFTFSNYLFQIVGFASQLFVIAYISTEDLGQIKVMQTYISYLTLFSLFGLNTSILKVCSENNSDKIDFFNFNFSLSFVFSILIYFLSAILIYFGLLYDSFEYKYLFILFALTTVSSTLNQLFISYLQSQNEFKKIGYFSSIGKFGSFIFIIILTYLYGVFGFVVGNLFGQILTSYVFHRITHSLSKYQFRFYNWKKYFLSTLRIGAPSFLSTLLWQISLYVDVIILDNYITDKVEVGYYAFAATLMTFFYTFTSSIQQFLIPKLSFKILNDNNWLSYLRKAEIRSFLVHTAIFVLSQFFLDFAIHLLFKERFNQSIMFIRILLISWLIRSFFNLKGAAILSSGKIYYNLFGGLVMFFIGLPILIVMVSRFQSYGAAYSSIIISLIGLLTWKILHIKLLKKLLIINN